MRHSSLVEPQAPNQKSVQHMAIALLTANCNRYAYLLVMLSAFRNIVILAGLTSCEGVANEAKLPYRVTN